MNAVLGRVVPLPGDINHIIIVVVSSSSSSSAIIIIATSILQLPRYQRRRDRAERLHLRVPSGSELATRGASPPTARRAPPTAAECWRYGTREAMETLSICENEQARCRASSAADGRRYQSPQKTAFWRARRRALVGPARRRCGERLRQPAQQYIDARAACAPPTSGRARGRLIVIAIGMITTQQ